jgi:hypothetical protein
LKSVEREEAEQFPGDDDQHRSKAAGPSSASRCAPSSAPSRMD